MMRPIVCMLFETTFSLTVCVIVYVAALLRLCGALRFRASVARRRQSGNGNSVEIAPIRVSRPSITIISCRSIARLVGRCARIDAANLAFVIVELSRRGALNHIAYPLGPDVPWGMISRQHGARRQQLVDHRDVARLSFMSIEAAVLRMRSWWGGSNCFQVRRAL